MSQPTKKVLQYLNDAHANELGMVRELEAQVAMTPRGSYRTLLGKHLRETRNHAERLQVRMNEIGESGNPFQSGVGAAGSGLAQAFAFAMKPFTRLRDSGGEEKVLENAEDACAAEALEIARYTALERLARSLGDQPTARLAASIRGDEEKMLARVLEEIPRLTESVVRAHVQGNGSRRDRRRRPRAAPPSRPSSTTARRPSPDPARSARPRQRNAPRAPPAARSRPPSASPATPDPQCRGSADEAGPPRRSYGAASIRSSSSWLSPVRSMFRCMSSLKSRT